MIKALERKLAYGKFFVALNIIFVSFIWLNSLRFGAIESGGVEKTLGYSSGLTPPSVNVMLLESQVDHAGGAVKCDLVMELKQHRQDLDNVPAYNLFADKLAQHTASFGWSTEKEIALYSQLAFPRQENRIIADYREFKNSQDIKQLITDTVDYWKNRGSLNGLKDYEYSQFGVGIANTEDGRWVAVLWLVEPMLRYSQPFPFAGDVKLTVTAEISELTEIGLKKHSYSRSWFSEIDEDIDERTLVFDQITRKAKIDIDAPASHWAHLEFCLQEHQGTCLQAIGPGRILRPSDDLINTDKWVIPEQGDEGGCEQEPALVGLGSSAIISTSYPQELEEQPTLSSLYNKMPNIAACYGGVLKDAEKQNALNALNHIRGLHKLKPVNYNNSGDVYTQNSALITAANNELTHSPDKSYKCWSPEGARGSGESNLHIFKSSSIEALEKSSDGIISLLVDENVESLGHRRWMIDPFLKSISYGRVDNVSPDTNNQWNLVTGVSLKVINQQRADVRNLSADFVAYPYEEYPAKYFQHGWYMSFSVLVDKSDFWGNSQVDYSNTTVDVSTERGQILNVHSTGHDSGVAGLPNLLKWKVNGTNTGEKYLVKINNVLALGNRRDYEYWFRIN